MSTHCSTMCAYCPFSADPRAQMGDDINGFRAYPVREQVYHHISQSQSCREARTNDERGMRQRMLTRLLPLKHIDIRAYMTACAEERERRVYQETSYPFLKQLTDLYDAVAHAVPGTAVGEVEWLCSPRARAMEPLYEAADAQELPQQMVEVLDDADEDPSDESEAEDQRCEF